jgi:hypothetical protein
MNRIDSAIFTSPQEQIAELVEVNNQLKIDVVVLEAEVERLEELLKEAQDKDLITGLGRGDNQEVHELEMMFQANLEAKDAQIADLEQEIDMLRSDNDVLNLGSEFLKSGMNNLTEQMKEKDMKLEFLDEAKDCIRDLTIKVNTLTEAKSSLEDQIQRLKKERKNTVIPNLNNSEILDFGCNLNDHDRSALFKSDSRLKESLVESILKSKTDMSKMRLKIEYKEDIRKMRVEKLENEKEFLKLSMGLNKLINSEVKKGEEQQDFQVAPY